MEALNLDFQQYLTFRLNEETFGVDVLQVREVMDYTAVTKVPRSPDYMLGVINLRGNVVPVIDLKKKFAMPAKEISRDSCIVVLEIAFAEEPLLIGALADGVQEVLDLISDQIEPAPRLGTGMNVEFILGMGKVNEEFVILLDLHKVFTEKELESLAE
ncbi:MAG: chemotaxis protein CheW [Desulfuromonas sp.]|nr:MAG: chemotaxis protein CheW [Desulfuromonas sp.]